MSNSKTFLITNDDAPNWRAVITKMPKKGTYHICVLMQIHTPLGGEEWVQHWDDFHNTDDLFEATIIAKGAIRRLHAKTTAIDDLSALINLLPK